MATSSFEEQTMARFSSAEDFAAYTAEKNHRFNERSMIRIGNAEQFATYKTGRRREKPSSMYTFYAYGMSILGKCTDGILFRRVNEALHYPLISIMSEREVRWRTGTRGFPIDTELILEATHGQSQKEVQRAILEICAVKMPSAERDQLLGEYGRDTLCKELREEDLGRKAITGPSFGGFRVEDYLLRHQWYKLSERGQEDQASALYQTIQLNPEAFLTMLK